MQKVKLYTQKSTCYSSFGFHFSQKVSFFFIFLKNLNQISDLIVGNGTVMFTLKIKDMIKKLFDKTDLCSHWLVKFYLKDVSRLQYSLQLADTVGIKNTVR